MLVDEFSFISQLYMLRRVKVGGERERGMQEQLMKPDTWLI